MKKFLMFLCAVMLVFGMVGSASAISFKDTEVFDGGLQGTGDPLLTFEWSHIMEMEEVWGPDYEIDYQTIEIKAFIDEVEFEGQLVGDGVLILQNTDTADVTLKLTSTWAFNDDDGSWALDVTGLSDTLGLTLYSSKLDVEVVVPTPEPSTILLMGCGLLGMVGWGRKRFSKKS